MDDWEDMTIIGQVLPFDADDEDDNALMILVEGEEEYIVEPGRMRDQLLEYIDRWVRVDGAVKSKNDVLCVMVHEYEIDDEDWDQDEDRW